MRRLKQLNAFAHEAVKKFFRRFGRRPTAGSIGGIVTDWVLIVLGSAIAAFALAAFLVPAQIVVGGATGVATILFHLFGWPVGVVSFVINVPLFVIGWRQVGRKFAVRSFVAMTLLSAFTDLFSIQAITQDAILSAIYGGLIIGLGLGFVLRSGASTGGSDLAAQLLRKWFPTASIAGILFVIDFIIIAASVIFFGAEQALYAFMALFISIRLIDFVIGGVSTGRAFWIVSQKRDNIAARIASELERGSTRIRATGTYSGQDRDMLLCIVGRSEVATLKRLVYQEDPTAFVMIADAREVLGEGFAPHQ
ncbi:MAG: YitT family protein [Christensenellales bacterium]|jgi:uncharacterized membrane-anchored protein YitT (DUF2179 family)